MLSAGLLFARVSGLLKRVPWQVWVALALIACVLFYGSHREAQGYAKAEAYWKAEIEALEAERQAALDSEERALRDLAKRTDRNVIQEREANRDRTERFIARGGVRQACPRNRDPEDRGTGSGASVREEAELDGAERLPEVVSVLPDDVRICTDNTILAEELRALILSLEVRNRSADNAPEAADRRAAPRDPSPLH
jgi:hypothetical protein